MAIAEGVIIREGQWPPSGWHYPQPVEGQEPITLRSDTKENLAQKIMQFRIDNSIPVGDPELDITEYVCTNWPSYCWDTGIKRELPKKEMIVGNTMIEKVTAWLANRYSLGSKITLVDDSVASQRAAVCIRCPANRQWRNNCAPCVDQVEQRSFQVRRGRNISGQKRLLGCTAAGHDNQVAVFMPEIALRHRKRAKLPSLCWMNKLTPEKTT